MDEPVERDAAAEPVGIIISLGQPAQPAPILWGYIWGDAPVKREKPKRPSRAA